MIAPAPHLTVLGALGDLAGRQLLPGVVELAARDELPPGFALRGVGREPIGVEGFKAHVERALDAHAAHLGARARRRVVDALDYRAADLQDLSQARAAIESNQPSVVYAALPPSVFPATVAATAAAGLPEGSILAIEKPLGRDLASGSALNALIARELAGIGVARVDHFLADELPRRVVELRRSVAPVAASWCGRDVESVEVIWDETLGSEGRGFYDAAGALRDVVQNHLLAVLSLVLLDDETLTLSLIHI